MTNNGHNGHAADERPEQVFPIAITGIGCRLPGGGNDVQSFWQMLMEARSGVSEVPSNRWNKDRFYNPDPACIDTMTTKWGGFIDQLDEFDARFWGITPREAVRMDPQQRWLLEVAWEALEDGGMPPSRLRGKNVGVFVGISSSDYGAVQIGSYETVDAYTNSGITASIASNRISYMFDLRGPSFSVDTACSSALVAVWCACQNIWTGKCLGALAGGVNAMIAPHASIGFSRASMLSRDGQCFAFDSRANGYVRGEGAGMVYLKPLDQAMADRDRIYAVIRGAAVNQDGHTSSMTVPSIEGQSAMLRQAYEMAGLSPNRVTFMEAHGTGTPVGDPIEVIALGKVLGENRPPEETCLIGSVKTNIGHLESASGIAGLIKGALVLHHGIVPANRNFEQPNPNIPFEKLRLSVVTKPQPLPQYNGAPPVVGVNSFGFGGTNAHVVLAGAPVEAARNGAVHSAKNGHGNGTLNGVGSHRSDRPHILPISARDDEALKKYVAAYHDLLGDPSVNLADACYCAGARKDHHAKRLVVIGKTAAEMRRRMATWLDGALRVKGIIAERPVSTTSALTFVYTGQGAQWWAMGRQLLARESVFRDTFAAIDTKFQALAGWSIREALSVDEADSRIHRTDVAQPAIFALQVALTELWKSWGISPARVVGHSVGEVAAAYVAGIHSLDDAVKIIYHRSRLQHSTGGEGKMLAVAMNEQDAREFIGADRHRVHVAVINSPGMITLAGDAAPLEFMMTRLQQSNRFHRWLPIDYAFHTHQMEPIRDDLLQALADLKPQEARIPFISTVTAEKVAGPEMDAMYWWQNVRMPVLFGPALKGLIEDRADAFLEIGPHPALQTSLRECLEDRGRSGAVFNSLHRDTDETLSLLSNLARLHIHGFEVDWAAINQCRGDFVRLPIYPWSREECWLETGDSIRTRLAPLTHPLLGVRSRDAQPTWQGRLDTHALAYLDDHRLWNSVVFPGAGYAEMGLAAAKSLFPDEPHVVEDLNMRQALFINPSNPPVVQTVFNETEKSFAIYSRHSDDGAWELNADGRVVRVTAGNPTSVDLARLRARMPHQFDHEKQYDEFLRSGYQFGPCFRQVRNLWSTLEGEALGEIVVPEVIAATTERYRIHPTVLDAFFHVAMGLRPASSNVLENFYLPVSIRRIRLYRENLPTHLFAYAKASVRLGRVLAVDIQVYDEQGERVAEILGFCGERVEPRRGMSDLDQCHYQFSWEPARVRGTGCGKRVKFPAIGKLCKAANEAAPELTAQRQLDVYRKEYVPAMQPFAQKFIENAFLDLGWKPSIGERVVLSELLRALAILPNHERLVRAQLGHLADCGRLRVLGSDEWTVIAEFERTDLAEANAIAHRFPQFKVDIEFLMQTGPHLAAVLVGDVDPVELFFPNGSTAIMEKAYVDGADFPVFNELIRVVVTAAIAGLPADRPVRMMEVGAGTGALTKSLLPALPADRAEYTCTDVGQSFLASSRKNFSNYAFVDYRAFDLNKDPRPQGLTPGSFDIIVATDVLHATADLRQTLTHLRACLAKGGLLIFLEEVKAQVFVECVTFGLLKGWWEFTDTDLRNTSPLLNREQWFQLLHETGFSPADSFTVGSEETLSDQAVFVAVNAGTSDVESDVPVASVAKGTLLAFADRQGVADRTLKKIGQGYEQTVRVAYGDKYQAGAKGRFTIRAGAEEDYRRLLVDAGLTEDNVAGILHAWSLDHPRCDDASDVSSEQIQTAQQTGALSIMRLAHVLPKLAPHLWFAVRDVFRVLPDDRATGLPSSPLIGMTRSLNNEFYPCRISIVDLGLANVAESANRLSEEISAANDELEVAYRDGKRHVVRFGQVRMEDVPLRTQNAIRPKKDPIPYRLESERPGALTNLRWRETVRRDPGPHEIEVRMRAGGINFRDVMKALGTYPGNPIDLRWFGDDFAGTVERVGKRVKRFRPGDRVAGMGPYAFQAFPIMHEKVAFKIPRGMTFQEAATMPTVFLTANYALRQLARMRRGETILIHGGAGGVGLAAIQIAQIIGLEIFATAGSPEKRELLKDLGVPHVMNSRTLDFADEIMTITRGRGVDAVLNSFAGDFIYKSLDVLAPFGRFLEIGKIDVYRNSKIGLQKLKDNISYFVIDLGQCLEVEPQLAGKLISAVSKEFSAGAYRPLPRTVFPISQVVEAFRHIAQGKHIGKNVLSFDAKELPIGPISDPKQQFRGDGTYLITGGARGLPFAIAQAMAQRGARHLVLMSRSGPADDTIQHGIDTLRAAGVDVVDARGDVRAPSDVERIVADISRTEFPLRGVIHGAVTYDDEFLATLDEERFSRVAETKLIGAWNLHRATRDLPLEHFVVFSSLSAQGGVPRQTNYNAGNYFLDALAHHRRAAGLAGLSIDWGAILGAGMVDRNRKTAEYLDKVGMKSFSLEETLSLFFDHLSRDGVQILSGRIDWRAIPMICPAINYSKTFAAIVRASESNESGGSLAARLQAASPETRLSIVENFIVKQICSVFGVTEDKLDRDVPLNQIGLDSLMAIELKNRVEREAGITVPMTEIMQGPTLHKLAEIVLKYVNISGDGEAAPAVVDAIPASEPINADSQAATELLGKIDDLSESEIDALLASVESNGSSNGHAENSEPAGARALP